MNLMKPKIPSKGGLGEMFQLLNVIQNSDEYQRKLEELTGAIARYEELCGIYKTIQEADAYKSAAKSDRDNATATLEDAKRQAEATKRVCEQECAELRHQAQSELTQASETRKDAERLRATLGVELQDLDKHLERREIEVKRREADVTQREKNSDALEKSLKAKADAIIRVVNA